MPDNPTRDGASAFGSEGSGHGLGTMEPSAGYAKVASGASQSDASSENTTNWPSISDATKACRSSFMKCLLIRSLRDDWAEDRLADFKLWDASVGASNSQNASLDERLEAKPHVRNGVVDLLVVLQSTIDSCRDLGLEIDRGLEYKDSSGGELYNLLHTTTVIGKTPDEVTRELSEAIRAADTLLNDLAQLSIVIRKAAVNSHYSKADSIFPFNSHNDPDLQMLRRHLTHIVLFRPQNLENKRRTLWGSLGSEIFEESRPEATSISNSFDIHAWNVSSMSRELTAVQERLIVANLRRHNRFKYSQRHEMKRTQPRVDPDVDSSGAEAAEPNQNLLSIIAAAPHGTSGSSTVDSNIQTQEKVAQPHQVATNVLSNTTASILDPNLLESPSVSIARSQQSGTQFSEVASAIKAQYPRPPRLNKRLLEVRCPCCCVPLQKKDLKWHRWRKHIEEDIQPYTCVLDACTDPEALYTDRKSWINHMTHAHNHPEIYWECSLCNDSPQFNSINSLKGHLTDLHEGSIRSTSAFLQTCSNPKLLGAMSCPLCSFTGNLDDISGSQLLNHVAEHIRSFSLSSLPLPYSEGDRVVNAYFETNAYFADSDRDSVTVSGSSISENEGAAWSTSDGSLKSDISKNELEDSKSKRTDIAPVVEGENLMQPRSQPLTTLAPRLAEALVPLGRMYSYKRIPGNQVRLLVVKPGAFDEKINASFLAVSDDDLGSQNYRYSALSYNWDDGADYSSIIIQEDLASPHVQSMEKSTEVLRPAVDKVLRIKPNLYEALRHLRQADMILGLWVDAVCINQDDAKEKGEQVLKIAEIYRKAYNVNVWLGSDNPGGHIPNKAMTFIPKIVNPATHWDTPADDAHVEEWASVYELLKRSWFSRRWAIQDLAFAQSGSVHCGKQVLDWRDLQIAIGIFDRNFDIMKARLTMHYESTQIKGSHPNGDPTLEMGHLGAKLLVDMKSTLIHKGPDGTLVPTQGLESLVCSSLGLDTSDPRDTINALRSISKEAYWPESRQQASQPPPVPDYNKDLFEIYRDFVKWVVDTTGSIDIICRHWALRERQEPTPTTPQLVHLPSWILFVEDSAWGKGEGLFRGRKAGDSFVGLPGSNSYNACGRQNKQARVKFPRSPVHRTSVVPSRVIHDMSMSVNGVMIGTVSFRTDPFPDSVITKDCLEDLGWTFDNHAVENPEIPDKLWQTLVADRDPQGNPPPHWYKKACLHCLTYQTNSGNLNISTILRGNLQGGPTNIVYDYLCRVRAVTWNRSFLRGDPISSATTNIRDFDHEELVGFGPPRTEKGDAIAILYGCSVPVILRPTQNGSGEHLGYLFVGEAYIYGKMYGEAFEVDCEEKNFKLL